MRSLRQRGHDERPRRPRIVDVACLLALLNVWMGTVRGSIIVFGQPGGLRVDVLLGAFTVAVLASLAIVGTWRGVWWARWLYVSSAIIVTLYSIAKFGEVTLGPVVEFLAGVAALALLLSPRSNRWFRAMKPE